MWNMVGVFGRTRRGLLGIWSVSIILSVVLWGPGCCSDADCASGASVQVRPAAFEPCVAGLDGEVCWEDDCVTFGVDECIDDGVSPSCSVGTADSSALYASCYLLEGDHQAWFVVLDATLSRDAVQDGDVWTVLAWVPGSNEVLVDATTTIEYRDISPNGPRCGPHCRSAVVVADGL